jgi:Ulp1 family protease
MNTLDVTAKELCCLLDKNWLNDTVVNFYVNLINISTNDNIHCMSSFFYQRLYLGFDKVEKWYKQNVFELEMFCIPLHMNGNHWTIAICFMN